MSKIKNISLLAVAFPKGYSIHTLTLWGDEMVDYIALTIIMWLDYSCFLVHMYGVNLSKDSH